MAANSDGITITFDADTQAAFSKIEAFVSKVNAKVNEVKDKSEEGKEEGGIFSWLVDATQAEEFVAGIGAGVAALFTLEKVWDTVKEAVRAYVENVSEAITRADEMGRAAEAVGVSLQTLNILKELGEQNRVPLETMEQALYLLRTRMEEAQRVGGNMAKVFRDWGISIFDSSGNLKSLETVLRSVMDRLHALGAEQGASAIRDLIGVRGPAGRELLDVLRKGSGALGESAGGITPEAAENARAFNTEIVKLKQSIEQLWNELAAALLPVLQQAVTWFRNLADGEQSHLVIGAALLAAFEDVAAAIVIVTETIRGMWVISNAAWGGLADGIVLVEQLFNDLKKSVADQIKVLIDFASAATKLPQIISEAAHGNAAAAKAVIADLRKDLAAVKDDAASAADHVGGFFENAFKRVSDAAKQIGLETTSSLSKIFNLGFTSDSSHPSAPSDSARGSASATGATPSRLSDTARQLVEEVNKAFAEATQSKVALLNAEEAKLKKKLDEEIPDTKVREEEKLKVTQIYVEKRLEIVNKEADEANAIALAKLKNQQSAITGNPNLTEVEKTQSIIPLLQQELALDQRQLDILRQRATDPRLNDEARLNAQKEYITLQGQSVKLAQELSSAQASLTISGQWNTALVALRNQFNALNEIGTQFQTIFSTAFNSISQNLTGVLEKTETWSVALRNIASSIIGSILQAIVKIGTTWVAQQLLMLVAGQTAKQTAVATDLAVADEEAALWAAPATLATIATEGEASAQAPALMAAALAEGQGLAFAAEGGLITGPTLTMMGEAGPEFVMRSEALRHYGADFMSALNSRRINAFSSGDSSAMAGSGFVRPSGSTNQGISVQGHQVSIAMLRDHAEIKQFLASAEGEAHIVKIARKNRYKIGVPT